ncbi:hypothetical protein McanMca71_004943 [Microsporum canis]
MSALRKLFSPDRALFQSEIADREQHTYPHSYEPISPDAQPTHSHNKSDQQFIGFEKQLEHLYEQLQSRPSQKRSRHIDRMSYHQRTKRHVDVLEAIFPKQNQYYASTAVSKSGSYNEDVAERNLASGYQRCGSGISRYSQVISAIYQEDVADRNMTHFSPPIVVSPPPGEDQSAGYNQRRAMAKKVKKIQDVSDPKSSDEEATLRNIASDQDIRRLPSCLSNGKSSGGRKLNTDSEQTGSLRFRKSAPALSVQFVGEDEQASATGSSAGKSRPQAKRVRRTRTQSGSSHVNRKPETKSSDLRPEHENLTEAKETAPESQNSENSSDPANDKSSRLLSPNTARRGSRRNVHDLSINTKLAAPGKKFAKISKRPSVAAVAAPPCRAPNASLDEIVNSPISLTSPVNPSPRITGFTAAEMLNLFKQAYAASQTSTSRPTFESLQDAIIREINSHDAFSHITPESLSPISPVPSLTPGLSSDGRHTERSSSRPATALSRCKSFSSFRDGSLSSKGYSLLEHHAKPEPPRRELSFPAIKEHCDTATRKRRHTYSQSASAPRVRIAESDNIPHSLARCATGKRPKSSAAAGQLPNACQIKGPIKQPGSDMRQQASHGFFSKAVSILLDSSDTSKHSQSTQPLRNNIHSDSASRVSSPGLSIFDDEDEKPFTTPRGKHNTPTKHSKLHLFIPSRKPARPKHIPIVISDVTTNNVPVNPPSGSTKKSSSSPLSSGRRRMPFRIIGT